MLNYMDKNYYYQEGKVYNLKNKEIGFLHRRQDGKSIYKIQIKARKLRRTHIVWFLYFKGWPVMELDHKDRDTLNDSIDNLQEVTHDEQQQNKHNYKGYKGFSIEERTDKKRNHKWRVRKKSESIELGNFVYIEDAVKAIDRWIDERGEQWKWVGVIWEE